MQTLLLDVAQWDLVLDARGNIAVASDPYSLAQDAASAIKTFLGEVFWDTTIGVPYLQQIFGVAASLALVKAQLADAALTVPETTAAQCFITAFTQRNLQGQVQVTSQTTGQTAVMPFTVLNPLPGGNA
jgi:hypothetical protein